MLRHLLIFAVVAALGTHAVYNCPPQLQRGGQLRTFRNNCFSFHPEHEREFEEAENFCRQDGGHLAIIRDIETQNFLYHVMHDELHYGGEVWIGLNDTNSEGTFVWNDGSRVSFTYWASGRPGNFLGAGDDLEDCVFMDMSDRGRWHDSVCHQILFISHSKTFICEYLPYCPPQLQRGGQLRTFRNNCFSFHPEHEREFEEAENFCRQDGGHLAIIRDIETQNFLYHIMHDELHYGDEVWIGLNDKNSEGTFVWNDGSHASFTYWASGQPSNFWGIGDIAENCVFMDMSDQGKWHDGLCSDLLLLTHRKPFICGYTATSPPNTTTTLAPTPTGLQNTSTETSAESGCPAFECNRDCGLSGYKLDDNGCLICQCVN